MAKPPEHCDENRLIARLRGEEYDRVCGLLDEVTLQRRQILFDPDEPIRAIYFPRDCVVSLLAVMEDGTAAEVATIGNEGMTGIPVLLGADSMPVQAVCQIEGTALRMSSEVFREELANDGPLVSVLRLYTQALLNQMARSGACYRLHAIEERFARWLLMFHDLVRDDEFTITHESLADLLGVRRASVTVAAGLLQRQGVIQYRRGRITILDRDGLESAACDCYGIIRREYDRLFELDASSR